MVVTPTDEWVSDTHKGVGLFQQPVLKRQLSDHLLERTGLPAQLLWMFAYLKLACPASAPMRQKGQVEVGRISGLDQTGRTIEPSMDSGRIADW